MPATTDHGGIRGRWQPRMAGETNRLFRLHVPSAHETSMGRQGPRSTSESWP
jgi:hypothetical protein